MAVAISRLVCLVLAAGLPALALASGNPHPQEVCPPIDPPTAHAAAVRAFIDPVTGKLRPATPEERRKAVAARSSRDRSGRTYELLLLPDGSRIVELDDAFFMTVRARRNSDGTVSQDCRTGDAASPGGEK
jgi:hypothetical protein